MSNKYELKEKARDYSIQEGIFASMKNSFGGRFFQPFAIAINSSNSFVAMITSITGLLGPISQLFSYKLIEKYSRKKIILKSIFYESFFYFLAVSTISGITWAGIHLAENNFIYDNIKKQDRGKAISYYNMYWGIGTSAGAFLGAILIKFLHTSFFAPIKLIFIISAIFGLVCILSCISKLKEIRKVREVKRDFLKKMIFHDGMKTINDEIHYIKSIPHYIEMR